MGSSVQAPPTPDEPERFDTQMETFEQVGRMWASHRMRTYHLFEAMLRGVQAGIREQISQPTRLVGESRRISALIMAEDGGDGRVRVVPENCPQCKRAWRYLDEESAPAPDSFIQAHCASGHRWRFSAEKLATFRTTDDVPLPEPSGEIDDGNGMISNPEVVREPYSGSGMRRVTVDGTSYFDRRCLNTARHVSHSWPPVSKPTFWCDGSPESAG